MAPRNSQACRHNLLTYLCSPHFGYTSYKPSSTPELEAVAEYGPESEHSGHTRVAEAELPNKHSWSFPSPLVLPQATLEDPDSEPQSYRDWYTDENRNAVTAGRKALYVVAAPSISAELTRKHDVYGWSVPKVDAEARRRQCDSVKVDEVAQYLSAFYHGLPVKVLDAGLKFVPWTERMPKGKIAIGLETTQECVRIRTRAVKDSIFQRQLNLNDLLDVVLSILPDDAYSVVMLVDHDIYEHEEDDFCCGRAFGGSRIAVVSTARYNPVLDDSDGLDPHHAWPGSHCLEFVLEQCESVGCEHLGPPRKKAKRSKSPVKPTCDLLEEQPAGSPLHRAVAAHHSCASADQSAYELWLARVCKTASHELGHCFCLDHCEYYACIMQSTSSCAEDAEQPPYLCPVDQRKVLSATGQGLKETYEALRKFCESRKGGWMWMAFAAWLAARIEELPAIPVTPSHARSGDRTHPILLT